MCDGDLGQVKHTDCATVIWDRKDSRNSRRRNEKGRVVFDRTGMGTKSSRRKTKVGFPPTFIFRPLTPPYVRVRIRRFLIYNDTSRSIPTMTDSLLARDFYCSLRLALSHYRPLPNIPCLCIHIHEPYRALYHT